MASEKQIAANKLNAQKSTGPTSQEGKDKSRFNAFRHGLTGQVSVMTEEDRTCHERFIKEYMDALTPDNIVERQLVLSIAEDNWRLNRARAIESNIYALGHKETGSNHPQIEAAFSQARAFTENTNGIQLLTLYEQRLHRQIRSCEIRLEHIQTERKAARAKAFPDAELLVQLADAKGEPVESVTVNGFVFSNTEIYESIRLSNRLNTAREYWRRGWEHPPQTRKAA